MPNSKDLAKKVFSQEVIDEVVKLKKKEGGKGWKRA
jgi:hypothetical protein